jgi:ketosteroid isomerase-like protein
MKAHLTAIGIALALIVSSARASPDEDRRAVAALDTAYQAAVERNDAQAMAAILHEDMILVLGTGKLHTRDELLRAARERRIVYERQVEDPGTQTVRLYGGHTAIVTARLWIKGVRESKPLELRLWFSDTYVRTPLGWRYVFGQASTPLPAE